MVYDRQNDADSAGPDGGNPELEKLGWKEEAHGHYALMAGFQGQRQWTDFMPNGDFSEAILNSSL